MGVGAVPGVRAGGRATGPLTGPLGVTGRYLSFVLDLHAAGEGATSGRATSGHVLLRGPFHIFF